MDFMQKVTELSKKVGGVAEKTYMAAKDKSGKIIEETKIKIQVNEKENEINEIFEQIGISVYEMYKSGEDVGNVFLKECKKVEKMHKDISDMEIRGLYLKNLRTCDTCKKIISVDDKFCTICGTKQKMVKMKEDVKKEVKVEEKQVTKACKSCGMVVDIDTKFCSKCGYEF